jgi:hypothetical protein
MGVGGMTGVGGVVDLIGASVVCIVTPTGTLIRF